MGAGLGSMKPTTETQTPAQLYVKVPNYSMFLKVYIEVYVIIVLLFVNYFIILLTFANYVILSYIFHFIKFECG
jgi:hypothetical protein